MAVPTFLQLKRDYDKQISDTGRLLREFKKRHQLTTRDLAKYGTGCSSRIHELRKEGHVIVTSYVDLGLYRYTYIGLSK